MRNLLAACSATALLAAVALATPVNAATAQPNSLHRAATTQQLSARRYHHRYYRRYYRHYGSYRPYWNAPYYAYEPEPYYYGPRYYAPPPFPFSLWPFW